MEQIEGLLAATPFKPSDLTSAKCERDGKIRVYKGHDSRIVCSSGSDDYRALLEHCIVRQLAIDAIDDLQMVMLGDKMYYDACQVSVCAKGALVRMEIKLEVALDVSRMIDDWRACVAARNIAESHAVYAQSAPIDAWFAEGRWAEADCTLEQAGANARCRDLRAVERMAGGVFLLHPYSKAALEAERKFYAELSGDDLYLDIRCVREIVHDFREHYKIVASFGEVPDFRCSEEVREIYNRWQKINSKH